MVAVLYVANYVLAHGQKGKKIVGRRQESCPKLHVPGAQHDKGRRNAGEGRGGAWEWKRVCSRQIGQKQHRYKAAAAARHV